MIYTVVSVLDKAAQAYGRPAFVQSRGVAVRSFTEEVNRQADDNFMRSHPADFELWLLGEFDDSSGQWTPALQILSRAVDVKV